MISKKQHNIAMAAQKTGINYENAKAIYRVCKKEGRNTKKRVYDRSTKNLDVHFSEKDMKDEQSFNEIKGKTIKEEEMSSSSSYSLSPSGA